MNKERLKLLADAIRDTPDELWNDEWYVTGTPIGGRPIGCAVARCCELWPDVFKFSNGGISIGGILFISEKLEEWFELSSDHVNKLFNLRAKISRTQSVAADMIENHINQE